MDTPFEQTNAHSDAHSSRPQEDNVVINGHEAFVALEDSQEVSNAETMLSQDPGSNEVLNEVREDIGMATLKPIESRPAAKNSLKNMIAFYGDNLELAARNCHVWPPTFFIDKEVSEKNREEAIARAQDLEAIARATSASSDSQSIVIRREHIESGDLTPLYEVIDPRNLPEGKNLLELMGRLRIRVAPFEDSLFDCHYTQNYFCKVNKVFPDLLFFSDLNWPHLYLITHCVIASRMKIDRYVFKPFTVFANQRYLNMRLVRKMQYEQVARFTGTSIRAGMSLSSYVERSEESANAFFMPFYLSPTKRYRILDYIFDYSSIADKAPTEAVPKDGASAQLEITPV